jgi:hypothetical protein
VEYDVWREGKNITHTSDLGGLHQDVTFKQTKGGGFGAEIGLLIPTALHISSQVFVAYHKWEVKDSDSQFDGVNYLIEPESETSVIQVGVGFDF